MDTSEAPKDVQEAFARQRADQAWRQSLRPQIEQEGEAALRRLFEVANNHSGQCRYVAAFLLGLYNGQRFPFDLTDLRCLDGKLFDDCIAVLRMDAQPPQEVHRYFPNGGQAFEKLASDWAIEDVEALRREAAPGRRP